MAEERVVLRVEFQEDPRIRANVEAAKAAGMSPADIAAAGLNVQKTAEGDVRIPINPAIAETKRKERQAKDEIDYERDFNLRQGARESIDVELDKNLQQRARQAEQASRERDKQAAQSRGAAATLGRFAPNPASANQTLARFGPGARPRPSSRVPAGGRTRGGGIARAGFAAGAASIARGLGLGAAGSAAAAAGGASVAGILGPFGVAVAAVATPAIIALGAAASVAARQLSEIEELGRLNAEIAQALAIRGVTRILGQRRRAAIVADEAAEFIRTQESLRQAILDMGAEINEAVLPIRSDVNRFLTVFTRLITPLVEEGAENASSGLRKWVKYAVQAIGDTEWGRELPGALGVLERINRYLEVEESRQAAQAFGEVMTFFDPGEFDVPEGAAGI